MGPQEKIIVREVDLGPVVARADHQDGAVEVNAKFFYKLPPMVQEFVLCHEVCHLKHNEWDEARTNQLAAQLFLDRSADEDDRARRREFLSYLDGNGGYSNFAWEMVALGVIDLGFTVFGLVKNRNLGWYSWDYATQKSNLDILLTQAFAQSRKTNKQSAAQIFWSQMQNYTMKDSTLKQFLERKDNAWVNNRIAAYEKKYGFGFEEVTPIDITAFPLVMLAVGLVVGFVVYKTVKKLKK